MKKIVVYIDNNPALDTIYKLLKNSHEFFEKYAVTFFLNSDEIESCLFESEDFMQYRRESGVEVVRNIANIHAYSLAIMDWGSGIPVTAFQRLRAIFMNRSKREMFILNVFSVGIPLYAVPHGIAINRDVIFTKKSSILIRGLRRLTHGYVLDFSDRNIFDRIFYFNSEQAKTYIRNFGIEEKRITLINPPVLSVVDCCLDGLIGVSMPKLRNAFNESAIVRLIRDIAFKESCSDILLLFHPREKTEDISKWCAKFDITLDFTNKPFNCISKDFKVIYDFGSSVILHALSRGISVRAVSGIMSSSMPLIDSKLYKVTGIYEQFSPLILPSKAEINLPEYLYNSSRLSIDSYIKIDLEDRNNRGVTTFVNLANIRSLYENYSLDSFSAVYSDGILLSILLSTLGIQHIKRRSFDRTSIAELVFVNAARDGLKILAIGGSSVEAESAETNFKRFYKTSDVKCINGFEDFDVYLSYCKRASPNIVVVSLGSTKQEDLALLLSSQIPGIKIYTSGAFVSQSAENINYYPQYINSLNLRWLYRAFRYRHVRRRLLHDYPRNIVWLLINRSIVRELILKILQSEKLLDCSSK